MPTNIRGLQSTKAKSQNKEEVVKKLGTRIYDWLVIPTNATITMCAITLMAFLLGKIFGIGIYLSISSYFFMKFFLKQLEKAPLKIPAQEKLKDEHQPNPGNGKPETGSGIFYIGTCTDRMYINKEIWLNNDDARQHFLVLGTTGAGKAIQLKSNVFTPSGWRKAEDLKVGDLITTPFDSTTAKITGVYPQGKRQLWRMTFKDGRTSEIDGEHLWEIHHKNWRGKSEPRVMTTKEIYELKQRNKGSFEIIISDPVDKTPESLSIPPYTLGTSLKDGFIPRDYLNGSLEQRIALFQGLMDTHGTYNKQNGLSYITVSEQLAKDVQELVWSLGGIASINEECQLEQPVFHVQIRLKNPKIAFSLPHKVKLVESDYQYEDFKNEIVSVEPLDKYEDCVCIMVDHPRHLYIMEQYVVTHNTELLTGFAANALSWGSGLIFVDGKGDIKLMATLHALSMRWGRSADFMILNFMPQTDANAPGEIASNTMNPYTTSSASDIIQQIGGLMPSAGGDGMWKDRAMTMISAVVYALAWARDNGLIDLNLAALRKYIQFPNLVTILTDEKFATLPDVWKNNLSIYLSSLAGYNGKPDPDQSDDCLKQHGFLEMQFTGPLGSLANDYGHIFNSEFGEVDMFDVVLNRRILVVMLPSLQKMPEDVERMGKIVVASLKTMMGATLGNVGATKGGKILDVMKRRVTTAPYPCLVILDEVGYYTVEGMAMMAAQVRSLGFSMIYASQDLKAMTRLNEKEAQSIIANTNTKIVMRTEDADTMELAVKAGGQGERVKSGSYQTGEDIFGNTEWSPDKNFAISFENRINELDLKSQGPGEFTLLHLDFIVRGKSFYVSTLSTFKDEDSVEVAPNQFIVVKRPDIDAIESDKKIPQILNKILDFNLIETTKNDVHKEIKALPDSELTTLHTRMKEERKNSNETIMNQLGVTLAYLHIKAEAQTNGFIEKTRSIRRTPDIYASEIDDDMLSSPPNMPNRPHGIEIDHNGLQDIDDSIIANSDPIMDAIMDIPTTEDMIDKTDDEKTIDIIASLDADLTDNEMTDTTEKVKESDSLMNDIFDSINEHEVPEKNNTSYSDIGSIDSEDILLELQKNEKKTDDTDKADGETTETTTSASGSGSPVASSSNAEVEEDSFLDLDNFMNAISKDDL